MLTTIIADDHQMFVNLVKKAVLPDLDVELINVAHNGAVLLEQLKTQQPDLIILDINMPVMDGMEAAKNIKELYPDIKILVVSSYIQIIKVRKILELGVDGYVLKKSHEDELSRAVECLMNNEKYYDQSLPNHITDGGNSITLPSGIDITERELQVIQLTAECKTAKEIAVILHISPDTVATHRRRLYEKLSVEGIGGLVDFAYENNLI